MLCSPQGADVERMTSEERQDLELFGGGAKKTTRSSLFDDDEEEEEEKAPSGG